MIVASLAFLSVALGAFLYRVLRGPSIPDRVVALDGLLSVVVSGIIVAAARADSGVTLSTVLVVSLVGFVGTVALGRFVERRGWLMSILGGAFMIVGSLFAMIGGIGVIRFSDLMSRVHAAAKAPTLGLMLVSVGAAIEIGTFDAAVALVLVVVLQLLTSPVATHVLARASYGQVEMTLDGDDDLAIFLEAGVDPESDDIDTP